MTDRCSTVQYLNINISQFNCVLSVNWQLAVKSLRLAAAAGYVITRRRVIACSSSSRYPGSESESESKSLLSRGVGGDTMGYRTTGACPTGTYNNKLQ